MRDINALLEGQIDRRKFLGAAGTALAGGLAGCGGSEGGNGSSGNGGSGSGGSSETADSTDTQGSDGTTSGDQEDTTTGSDGAGTGNEPGDYPTQESSGLQAELDQLVSEDENIYAFKIEDYDFLNVEDFPDITDDYEESSLSELARSTESVPLDQALYLAVNMETEEGQQSDSIYFGAESPETSNVGITMYVNLEDQEGSLTDQSISVKGIPPLDLSSEEKAQRQQELYENHIDPDGIVHAVDLADHDYAVEALHSGYGSE
jgi:hypothetical protein